METIHRLISLSGQKKMAHKTQYSNLFAPPKFLERRSVSVEILPTGISFLTVKNSELGILPDMFGFIPLPQGVVSNNEIVKRDVVVEVLSDIKKKTNVDFVRFSLPEEKTYIFKDHLPCLKPKEIYDILDFKIDENVPLSSKEATFDYEIVPNSIDKTGSDIVVSVAPLDFVENMQDVFNSAGLTPILFSPESNNIAKSVVKNNNEQVVVIVNIKESNIILSLVIFGVVCQTSSLGFGASTFTDLLAKYFKISIDEAVKIKHDKLYINHVDNAEIFSYLINTISAIKDEIYKFISYCNQREDVEGQVDRIILCGRDAMIVGFDKYLALNLEMKVDVANVWANNFDLDSYTPEIKKIDSLDYANLNGLSII